MYQWSPGNSPQDSAERGELGEKEEPAGNGASQAGTGGENLQAPSDRTPPDAQPQKCLMKSLHLLRFFSRLPKTSFYCVNLSCFFQHLRVFLNLTIFFNCLIVFT